MAAEGTESFFVSTKHVLGKRCGRESYSLQRVSRRAGLPTEPFGRFQGNGESLWWSIFVLGVHKG